MSILAAYLVPHPPLIVPEVGRGGERQIPRTQAAYERVAGEIAALRPETILISSPHAAMYSNCFQISPKRTAEGDFGQFGAPQVHFRESCDTALSDTIQRLSAEAGLPVISRGQRCAELDHGTMVPLYFIRKVYSDFKLVRIGLSGLPLEDHYRLGQVIQRAVEKTGRRVVYIASGDLSHKLQSYGPYGFAPEGPDGQAVEARRLSHEDITGVGYGVCAFRPTGPDAGRRFLAVRERTQEQIFAAIRAKSDPWVQLAWQSVESYVRGRVVMKTPAGLPAALTTTRAGAFVSIHKKGQLRGCIGTILPTRQNLAEEIIHNAVSAAARDPRFDPIRPEELRWLEIHVDVLGEPEDIRSEAELDVKRYGVIVSRGSRRGLLLPDLEGVDTVERQVAIAREKARIAPWEPVTLQRFEVIRHT